MKTAIPVYSLILVEFLFQSNGYRFVYPYKQNLEILDSLIDLQLDSFLPCDSLFRSSSSICSITISDDDGWRRSEVASCLLFSLATSPWFNFVIVRRFRERIAAFAVSAEKRFFVMPLVSRAVEGVKDEWLGVVFSIENFDNGRLRAFGNCS